MSEPESGRGKTPRWSSLVQRSSEAMFALSGHGRLLFANARWEQLTGLAFADVRGRTCGARLSIFAAPDEVWQGRPVTRRRRHGSAWWDLAFFPWMQGEAVSVVLVKVTPIELSAPMSWAVPEALMQLYAEQGGRHALEAWPESSPQVSLWKTQIRLAAGQSGPTLIVGPAGSGKEWVARAIHQTSPQREQAFAALDLALLPESVWSYWLGEGSQTLGTVLVKNAQLLPADGQRRWLERGEQPGPRWLFAAPLENAPWLAEFACRIAALTIRLLPLVERRAEWEYFLKDIVLAPEALEVVRLHDWPGNVRELRDVLGKAGHRAGSRAIEPTDLPLALRQQPLPVSKPLVLDTVLENVERRLIEEALAKTGGNKAKAAEMLGIWRARLIRRVEQLGLK